MMETYKNTKQLYRSPYVHMNLCTYEPNISL